MDDMEEYAVSVLTSVLLNLLEVGEFKKEELSPYVLDYIAEIETDYDSCTDDEKELLYWFAHRYLSGRFKETYNSTLLH